MCLAPGGQRRPGKGAPARHEVLVLTLEVLVLMAVVLELPLGVLVLAMGQNLGRTRS
jgi:hypothetical protein